MMSNDLFVCSHCGTVDLLSLVSEGGPVTCPLVCTCCLPPVAANGLKAGNGSWHNYFPKRQYDPSNGLVINRPNGLALD